MDVVGSMRSKLANLAWCLPAADLRCWLSAWRSVVAPEVPEQLREAFLEACDNPDGIRSMQNKQMAAQPLHQPGALLLGDAFNMRHPLTGGGMTVALSDCEWLQPAHASWPYGPHGRLGVAWGGHIHTCTAASFAPSQLSWEQLATAIPAACLASCPPRCCE